MTKRYPVPYFVKKTLAKTAHPSTWAKDDKEAAPTAREEILEAIKRRVQAKKKKR